ncbi:MAG: recA-like protein [Erythrobacter sp.]
MPRYAPPSGAKTLQTHPVSAAFAGDGTCLSTTDIAALSKLREARWRPGLTEQPLHSEIFASSDDASGAGVALALARDALRVASTGNADPLAGTEDHRQVLWVQDARAIERSGRPCVQGLPDELRGRLIHVAAQTPEDALFALEEGLKCRDLACVIGEIVGNPRGLDFTASRRLSLTAEKHGVALWLVRLEAQADLSSARMRWRIEAAPSATPRWNHDAPGTPRWKAELFRARAHAPGQWILNNDKGYLRAGRPGVANSNTAISANINLKPDEASTAYPRYLARATVGRSLAIVARM